MKSGISWKEFSYVFLIGYIIFVSYSFYNLHERMDDLLNHPVRVLEYARDITTRLGELKNTLPGLMATPNLSYEDVEKVLQRQEDMQDKSFNKISEIFLGDSAKLTNLRNAFVKIRYLRREAAKQLRGNTDYNKSVAVYEKLVEPQVSVVMEATNQIMQSATGLLEKMQQRTSRDAIINIFVTLIVGFFIAAVFYIGNKKDKIKTLQLEDRDRLFKQLSKNVDEIFIVAASAGQFDYVTSNSDRLIKIPSNEILADPQKLYDFLPEDDVKWLKDILKIDPDESINREKTVMLDNSMRVFKLSVYPFRYGPDIRAIIALQEITNEHRQRQALSDALENAHAASVAKSSFLSHMSHEIRTPMNAIIGMTTIALSRMDNPQRVEDCLVKIGESSRHLLRLINDVLDMSKIENGKLSINHEQFSLPDAIRNINDLVRPQADDKQLQFEIFQNNVDEEELIGDPLRLNQVLLNILSNSLKFTPPGGLITLTIKQLHKTSSSVRMAFVITDTGIGMSKEFLEKIYLPFEQATAKTTAKYGGTGLGMSITFNLIMLMGGTIHVESREGHGSTFTVELPFGYNAKTRDFPNALPKMRILVVDDDCGTCEHAYLLLDKMGMSVRWATSGSEALDVVKEAHDAATPFDVCFIDWKMPEMDGAETARRIRQIAGEDVMIIIITAYDWSSIEESARAAGVNDFLAKPFFASSIYNILLASTRKLESSVKPVQKTNPNEYDFSGKRILLVEDNEFNREIAQEFLDMVNIEVEDAENGQEAVDKFMASEPGYYDLILMDVQMPVMNGYEATKAIRTSDHADGATVPIIAMTANAFSEDVTTAVASGMNGHIAKPVDVNNLYAKIRSFLEKN